MRTTLPSANAPASAGAVRHLVLVLGDQLDRDNAALIGFDRARDAVLMIEAAAEGEAVWSHKARIALFLAAMRHHHAWLQQQGRRVIYSDLAASGARSLSDVLFDLLAGWVPNEAMRNRILVNNPEMLYDFAPSAR